MSYILSPWKLQSNLDYPEYERIFQTFLSARSVFLLLLCWVPTSLSQQEKKRWWVFHMLLPLDHVCVNVREKDSDKRRERCHTQRVPWCLFLNTWMMLLFIFLIYHVLYISKTDHNSIFFMTWISRVTWQIFGKYFYEILDFGEQV